MKPAEIFAKYSKSSSLCNPTFYSVDDKPFSVYGVQKDELGYFRMPPEIAKRVSEGVDMLNRHTAGGVIRFKTNANTLAIYAKAEWDNKLREHMTPLAAGGFDAFSETHYIGAFPPCVTQPLNREFYCETGLCTAFAQKDADGFFEVSLYMPIYGAYTDIHVGISEGYKIIQSSCFSNKKPVVFYGSSITQGECGASPGNTYVNMISRNLNLYVVNLGFSGNAKAEPEMVKYLSGLECSAFVMDYDHNAPNSEYLSRTHEQFYKSIRQHNPFLPIIMGSAIPMLRTERQANCEQQKRIDVIYKTYKNAVEAGDKNVYFLNGCELFDDIPFDCSTVDGIHPNTLGMYLIAKGYGEILNKLNL